MADVERDGDWAWITHLNLNNDVLAFQPALYKGNRILAVTHVAGFKGPADLEDATPFTVLVEDEVDSLIERLAAWRANKLAPPPGERPVLIAELMVDELRRKMGDP